MNGDIPGGPKGTVTRRMALALFSFLFDALVFLLL